MSGPSRGWDSPSYGFYLWQQLLAFGEHPRLWYFPLFAVEVAAISYCLLGQPMIRLREILAAGAPRTKCVRVYPSVRA